MEKKRINEVMPNLMVDGGIFKSFSILSDLELTATQLGIMYNFHSGEKCANSLLRNYLGTDGKITEAGETLVGGLLDSYFGDKWDRLNALMIADYDPTANYDRNELTTVYHEGYDKEAHEAQTNSISQGAQSNSSSKGQQTNTDTQSTVPFDNLNEVEAGEHSIVEGARSDSETIGARQDIQTLGAHSIDNIYNSHETTEVSVSGNIGVTTTQQMMQSEIDIRQYSIIEQMFKDIDGFIALKIYC